MIDDELGLWLEHVPAGAGREGFVPLLLLADVEQQVRGYLQAGELYVLRGAGGEPLGATLVINRDEEPGTAELRAVTIDEQYHRRGLGRRMLERVLDDLRQRGVTRAVVGTSNAGIGEIAFYQKAGFRLWRIERDVFTPERGYDPEERLHGLAHRDMVWFEREL
jgi:ribosomal protein S18 acetylase RimI-like enzyme